MLDTVLTTRKNIEAECLLAFDQVLTAIGSTSYQGQGANNQFDPGFGLVGRQRFQYGDRRVDLDDRIVIVEVESGGGATNLVKYWPWAGILTKPLLLLHGFGQLSANDYISHLKLWEYLWTKMREDLWSAPTPRMFAHRFQFTHGNIEQLQVAAAIFRECLTLPLDRVLADHFGYVAAKAAPMRNGSSNDPP